MGPEEAKYLLLPVCPPQEMGHMCLNLVAARELLEARSYSTAELEAVEPGREGAGLVETLGMQRVMRASCLLQDALSTVASLVLET